MEPKEPETPTLIVGIYLASASLVGAYLSTLNNQGSVKSVGLWITFLIVGLIFLWHWSTKRK